MFSCSPGYTLSSVFDLSSPPWQAGPCFLPLFTVSGFYVNEAIYAFVACVFHNYFKHLYDYLYSSSFFYLTGTTLFYDHARTSESFTDDRRGSVLA